MTGIKTSPEIDLDRRRFLGAAAATIVSANLSLIGSADAQSSKATATAIHTAPQTSFASLKQIAAGLLNVGYAEAGPADGPAVILLHGWPYDIYSFVDVAPPLASHGYRVIVPYLRGYGTTSFLSSETVRNGQQSVVAVDMIALMDALKIRKAIVAGFDWGARTANIMAALWPERCKALVSVSGYLIGSPAANEVPLPPKAESRVVVSVLFRHGPRSLRLRQVSTRLCEAHLATRIAKVELRRCHLRSFCGRLRQSKPCRHCDSQLQVEDRPGEG